MAVGRTASQTFAVPFHLASEYSPRFSVLSCTTPSRACGLDASCHAALLQTFGKGSDILVADISCDRLLFCSDFFLNADLYYHFKHVIDKLWGTLVFGSLKAKYIQ